MPEFRANMPGGQPFSEWFWGGTGEPGNIDLKEGFSMLGEDVKNFLGIGDKETKEGVKPVDPEDVVIAPLDKIYAAEEYPLAGG